MVFVDGENLAIRGKALADKQGISISNGPYYEEGSFVWMPGQAGTDFILMPPGQGGQHIYVVRSSYYTSVVGDDKKLEDVKERLWQIGFQPSVFKKAKNQKSKGVDIALTKDMLSHAYLHNYEVAVLVSGDGDYVPVLEELKRLGKLVCVAFFIDEGFNDKLRLASDFVSDMTPGFLARWKQATDS